jgi:hypothetical protein
MDIFSPVRGGRNTILVSFFVLLATVSPQFQLSTNSMGMLCDSQLLEPSYILIPKLEERSKTAQLVPWA